ncbi:MAG: carbohydrate kinase family protein [Victivallales bacterium]|jgi:sugar/nucleoside kinase (ribokinase family)|nr:carbohydrate kinase family protein [Victivallales bacterium]
MKHAVVAGHICLDIIPDIDRPIPLDPGRLYEVGSATIATGGAVSNTGVALHLLGVATTLMGKIGSDDFGAAVRSVLDGYGAELTSGMLVSPGETTSYTVVVNIPGTDRIFLHCPGANSTFVCADLDLATIAAADLFHFGYPSFMAGQHANGAAELVAMYKTVRELGTTTSLDLGMPDPSGPAGGLDWRGILERTVPHLDVFMPSADELLYCLDRDRFGEGDAMEPAALRPLADELLAMGAGVAAIKMGARGMYVRTAGVERIRDMGRSTPAEPANWADRELWFPIYKEDRFVGATGAGDTTIAGFLAALMRGTSLEDAGSMANAVGACNVEAPDALGGIRTWAQTMARLDAGWERISPGISDPGWHADADGLWHGPSDR